MTMGKRILIVDDEPDIRLSLQLLLSSKGYDVAEAEDGAVALQRLTAEVFSLVIMDIRMPELDGYQVMRQLPADVLDRTPIVLLTAMGQDRDVMTGYSMGATYYITKPFKNQHVLDIVDYLVGDLDAAQKAALEGRL
jgi:DNA-binding response OmpR family regulator